MFDLSFRGKCALPLNGSGQTIYWYRIHAVKIPIQWRFRWNRFSALGEQAASPRHVGSSFLVITFDSILSQAGFESRIGHFFAVAPHSPLNLSFFIYKVKMVVTPTTQGCLGELNDITHWKWVTRKCSEMVNSYFHHTRKLLHPRSLKQ